MSSENSHKKHVISIPARTCFRIGITLFLVYLAVILWKPLLGLLGRILTAAAPLLLGFALAYIVNILMRFYEKHYFRKRADEPWVGKTRRPVCLIGALATILGAIILLLYIVLPQLVSAVSLITHKIPGLLEDLSRNEKIMHYLPEEVQKAIRSLDYKAMVQGVLRFLSDGVSADTGKAWGLSSLTGLVGSLTSRFMIGFMGFIFSIYILVGKEKLSSQFGRLFKSYLGQGWTHRISPVFSVANGCFHSFIVGQVTEAIIIGVLCAAGMWIFRLPYAAMVGTVIGVTALIPVLGCYLGAIIGALMCLSVSPVKAIEFLIFIFVLQQLEDNLIYPRVVGTSLGLPGIWVLASVTIGGGIGGIFGMLLAVPICATIYQLVKRNVQNREKENSRYLTAADVVSRMKENANE